jgi:hypothetical protein
MKRIFSEVQRRRMLNSQIDLLKQDLKDCLLLIKNRRYRSSYIFLFDSFERLFDAFFVMKGEKPTNRREREELIFKNFSPEIYRKFRSFYYERRGGMYEDFLLITKKDFFSLFKFFRKVFSEIKERVKRIDHEIETIMEKIEKIE